ncbi:MAG: hypothetical protein GKR94_33920 [Gammaproteobacteria bacterium]|nr:hypothetical protein [Gammaproteobacteria bacterium]
MTKQKKVRWTIDMPSALDQRLTALADNLGLTKSEITRRALVLMEQSHDAITAGKHVGIATASENLETEFIGI